MKKTIGIIGGMGPMATCDLMKKIFEVSDADCDQNYVHVCVDCNTNIPDRTKAILENGEDPIPEMVKSAVSLQNMGADLLMIPCNTAHFFYDRLKIFTDIPILHMPRETVKALKEQNISCAAVLATDGVIKSGVYEKELRAQGIKTIYPDAEQQQKIMAVIYQRPRRAMTSTGMQPSKTWLSSKPWTSASWAVVRASQKAAYSSSVMGQLT